MADEIVDKGNEALFADVGASGKPSLGDPLVVEAMLRSAVKEVLTAAGNEKSPAILQRVCRRVANVLIGKNPKYAPIPGWNEPTQINEFAGKWLGAGDSDPDDQMEHCVLLLMQEMLDLADYVATPGVLPEQWQWQVDAAIQKYTAIFMGIDPPTQALM